jgi:uncharacterized damage-inducible protein DinB
VYRDPVARAELAALALETVPTVVVDGRPVVSGFYDARKLARALGLAADAWGVPAPRPPERRASFIADLDRVAEGTAAAVRLIPDGRLDERPEEELWSLRELGFHSFAFNNRVMRALTFGEAMTWPVMNAYIEESRAFPTAAAIAEAGLQLHSRFAAWYRAQPVALWTETLTTFSGEQDAEDMLFFALGHMAYHLVQLYRYLDLVGVADFERLPEDELLSFNEPTAIGGGTELAPAH